MTCPTDDRTKHFTALGTKIIDTFKQVKDINPKVIQDFNSVFEKFPCNEWISIPLERIVSLKLK